MFKTRLLSGILLVIIALVTVITGGNLLFAVLLLISLIGMTELYKVFHIEKKAPGIVGYIFAILYYGLLYFKPLLPGESLNWFVMLFMAFLICRWRFLYLPIRNIIHSRFLPVFWNVLCGSDALLHLSDKKSSGRNLLGMACICMLLGM